MCVCVCVCVCVYVCVYHNTTNVESNQNIMETVLCFINMYIFSLFHRNNFDSGRRSNFEIQRVFNVHYPTPA